ncbi:ribonuclease Z [Flavobacterium terrisoli]|uniref:ribonuclease Z n=1 Tax=Flavobacterium terrisoli TaxID=3242195 RepID=UPI002542B328|nr:ribonuclease Z [Flavobacterium buctense]
MKVEQKGHTTIIKDTNGETAAFLDVLTREYNSYKNDNLILDLSYDKNLKMEDVKSFTELIKLHKKQKKSIVLVSGSINFNAVPKSITLVPTILEAHDIIEMEEIERDLGF